MWLIWSNYVAIFLLPYTHTHTHIHNCMCINVCLCINLYVCVHSLDKHGKEVTSGMLREDYKTIKEPSEAGEDLSKSMLSLLFFTGDPSFFKTSLPVGKHLPVFRRFPVCGKATPQAYIQKSIPNDSVIFTMHTKNHETPTPWEPGLVG